FLAGLTFDHPEDVELGPDGSLYVLEYGTYWFARNPNARLSRVVYHAGNRPPTARLVADAVIGAAPLAVKLPARGSADPDGVDASDAEDGRLGSGIDTGQVRVTLDYLPQGAGASAAGGGAGHQADPPGLALIRRSDCLACHGVDQASVGPSFRMVAQRYAGQA